MNAQQKPKCSDTANWFITYDNYCVELVCDGHLKECIANPKEFHHIINIAAVYENSTKECECYAS